MILTIVEACGQQPELRSLRNELNALRREVVAGGNALLSRRHTELAVLMLCYERGFRLCMIFDEFDEVYRALPALGGRIRSPVGPVVVGRS